jgi:hypothetical protein
MSLTVLEDDAVIALKEYLASGYTIDLGGLILFLASQFTPSDPESLAILASSAFLMTREPDLRFAPEGLTPYALLRSNVYERLAARMVEECGRPSNRGTRHRMMRSPALRRTSLAANERK